MKRMLLLTVAALSAVFMMAAGNGSGKTKDNAIEFDWDQGVVHPGGATALWYRVDLALLYDEDDPALTLYLTNPSRDKSVYATMTATVAGQTESRDCTIAPHQHRMFSENASLLVRMKQTEIFLTLKSDGPIKLSAHVFESVDLDETCKEAKTLQWNTEAEQTAGYAAWWRVNLSPVKNATDKDAKITITNKGSKELKLRAGQSLDCPSSGLTKREFTIPAGESVIDTIPRSMVNSVMADDVYFSIENNQPISMLVELIQEPEDYLISPEDKANLVEMHVADTFEIPAGRTLYAIAVAEMNSLNKYEPEFTYRNEGAAGLHLTTQLAFEAPTKGANTANYDIAAGGEEIVVYKKNMLEGLGSAVDTFFILVTADQPVQVYGRFKHVREGKACKTNIDFDWVNGHSQDSRTTQWYAIDVAEARDTFQDIVVYLKNEGTESATLHASLAFSCPYIDLQEVTRSLGAGQTISRVMPYSTYAMMSDTVFIGLETSQDIRLWATTTDAKKKEVVDEACLDAQEFNWVDGVRQKADTSIWYKINMAEVRDLQQFPTIYVQNLGEETATITGELSLECPDEMENQKRSMTIPAKGTYSKKLSRNMFENIAQDEIYLRVTSTQEIVFQVRLTEETEGSSCNSAIRFNWISGNDQAADASPWYAIDLTDVMASDQDIIVRIKNKDNKECKGSVWMAYECPFTSQQALNFTLGAKKQQEKRLPHSMLETLNDNTLWVRLIGSTALHIEAELVAPAPFDTIHCEEIVPDTIEWNTLYTHPGGSSWYVIPNDILKSIAELTTTPEMYVKDLSGKSNKITADIAYKCPITATMMSQTRTLSAKQSIKKIIERGTIEQVIQKDMVLIRINSQGAFEFKAELVEANKGQDWLHAVNIARALASDKGGKLQIEPNVPLRYVLDMAELKAMQDWNGKSVHIATKNKGGKADIKIQMFDRFPELPGVEDMFMGYGNRSIPAGQTVSHAVPAAPVYALGNEVLYIQVESNQPMEFSTAISEYAKLAEPINVAELSKLLVPNVEYIIPADTTLWFVACAPYLLNNFELTYDDTYAEFENLGKAEAKVTVSGSFQDILEYQLPERSIPFSVKGKNVHIAAGKKVKGTLRAAIDKALNRIGMGNPFENNIDTVNTLIRRYITDPNDSLNAYVRIRTSQPLRMIIKTPQGTGAACDKPMMFDWEHGNVNPKDQTTLFKLEVPEWRIPEGKDLKLHVDNWSEAAAKAKAEFNFDCFQLLDEDKSLKTIEQELEPGQKAERVITRAELVEVNWPESYSTMYVRFNSDQDVHIWAELIDQAPDQPKDSSDIDGGTQIIFACDGATVTDPIDGTGHVVDYSDITSMTWTSEEPYYDAEQDIMRKKVYTIVVAEFNDPALVSLDNVTAPVIKRGAVIDASAAETEILAALAAAKTDDVKAVTALQWEWSLDGSAWNPIAQATPAEAVAVRYSAVTECDDVLAENSRFRGTARDTVAINECNYFTWEDSLYIAPTLDSVVAKLPNGCDSIAYLDLKLEHPFYAELPYVELFGNRVLMIDVPNVSSLTGWNLPDSVDTENLVTWYQETASGDVKVTNGYFIATKDENPLVGTFFARIEIAPTSGNCGYIGETKRIVCAPSIASAPALMPTLARPNEDITVINLNPQTETTIRIYSTEGLVKGVYTVSGQETFVIKAANEEGFYIVELFSDNMKSTLRYIVK